MVETIDEMRTRISEKWEKRQQEAREKILQEHTGDDFPLPINGVNVMTWNEDVLFQGWNFRLVARDNQPLLILVERLNDIRETMADMGMDVFVGDGELYFRDLSPIIHLYMEDRDSFTVTFSCVEKAE